MQIDTHTNTTTTTTNEGEIGWANLECKQTGELMIGTATKSNTNNMQTNTRPVAALVVAVAVSICCSATRASDGAKLPDVEKAQA